MRMLPDWPLKPGDPGPGIVVGEVYHPVNLQPLLLTIPERGLYTGGAVFGAVGLADPGRKVDRVERSVRRGEGDRELVEALHRDAEGEWDWWRRNGLCARSAPWWSVSPSLVYAYVERRQIPHYRMRGRSIRFRFSELAEWRQQFHVNGGIDEQNR